MRIVERTYVVEDGCPARRLIVTFEVGGERRIRVEDREQRQAARFRWIGKGYCPGSEKCMRQTIEAFDRIIANRQPVESINQQLLEASRSPPAAVRRPAASACDVHERQLPTGDRA